MTLLEDLLALTANGGAFSGFGMCRIVGLFAALSRYDNMRLHASGQRTNKTQQRFLAEPFLQHHDLSLPQYECLVRLCDQGPELHGLSDAVENSLPLAAPPAPAAMACKYFACDFGPKCCGVSMRVGKFPCVAHTVGRSFRAVHVKKTCMGACGRVYYLNKKTSSEQLGVHDVRTHTFHPWSDGEPEWIASKSGKTICSVALLMSFAIAQCTMRWVLQQCVFGPSTSHSRSDRLTQTCANLLSDLDSRSTHN